MGLLAANHVTTPLRPVRLRRRWQLMQAAALGLVVACSPLFVWPATLAAAPVLLVLWGALHIGTTSSWLFFAIPASIWGAVVFLGARRITSRPWLSVVIGLLAAAWMLIPWTLISAGD